MGDFPRLNQGQIAGAAANIHVQDSLARVLRPGHSTGTPGGQDALQIRTCCGYHKVSRQIGQGMEYRSGVFLAAGFAGDDNSTCVHRFPGDARFTVFFLHDTPQRRAVHVAFIQQGCKVDRASVEDFSVGDRHFRNGKGRGTIFHRQFREDHLGGGGTHVQSDAAKYLRHGRSPLPGCGAPGNPPGAWGWIYSRDQKGQR